MTLSFRHQEVRERSIGKEQEMEDLFKQLCAQNRAFLSSIESTTKSLTATHARISIWFEHVNNILGTTLPVPQLVENRIV